MIYLVSKILLLRMILNTNETFLFQVKVWFQNRRTKHKREETEGDQQQHMHGGAKNGGSDYRGGAQTMLEEEEDDEDIDCE